MRLIRHTTFPASSREDGSFRPPDFRWRHVEAARPLSRWAPDDVTEGHRHALVETTS